MKNILQNSLQYLTLRVQFWLVILVMALLVPSVIVSQTSPPRVNLGSASDYVILAKTGISSTGTTDITGDLGISPSAATYLTGLGLILDASNTFSASNLVTGKIYAADYADPTPAKLTTAVTNMETAYIDAAGRTLPDYTELYAGDLTGQTLTRGIYKWSTAVLVSASGVTISGNSTDIWIFQIAQNLELANGANVTLIGGALASNIFWQVAGQTTLGTTSAMKGIILCQTQIVLSTGATLVGKALAQTAVTLDANSVTNPVVTSVGEDFINQKYTLEQNYPNPFNPSTNINYSIETPADVTLRIYNILGSEVATLVNVHQEAGSYTVPFNTKNLVSELPSGIYFYRLQTRAFVSTKKFVLMK